MVNELNQAVGFTVTSTTQESDTAAITLSNGYTEITIKLIAEGAEPYNSLNVEVK